LAIKEIVTDLDQLSKQKKEVTHSILGINPELAAAIPNQVLWFAPIPLL